MTKPCLSTCPKCRNHPVIIFTIEGKPVYTEFASKCGGILLTSCLWKLGHVSSSDMLKLIKDIESQPCLPAEEADENKAQTKEEKVCGSSYNPKIKEAWRNMN